MKLSIIIPVFNEERFIEPLINKLIKITYPSFVKNFEIIMIDDCSRDKSYQISKKLASKISCLSIIKHSTNKGKGASIKKGIAHATGDVFIIQDADDELMPDDIPFMLETMVYKNVVMVNGSRFMEANNKHGYDPIRTLGNRIFSALASLISGVKITDVTCGYKLFRKSLWEQLDIKENGFAFEVEILLKALKTDKNNVVEVPVHYHPRKKHEGKKIRAKDTFVILWAIFKYGLFRK